MKKIVNILFLLLLIFNNPYAYSNGEDLYNHHCSACHGINGDGGVGIPLSLPTFLDRASDEYLTKTIELGRPGRVMPAFSGIGESGITSIVNYIRSWSKKAAPVYEVSRINGDREAGKKLYLEHCVSCHGKEGSGGKGTGVTFSRSRALSIIAPSLGNEGFLTSASDHMIKDVIKQGRKGTPMMSFANKGLTDKQINNIVSYIRSLEDKKRVSHPDVLPPLLVYESEASIEETLAAIKKAIVGSNFRVIRVQRFDDGYVEKGKGDDKKIIIYFCNFNMLYSALAIDPRVGLFLPCRITLIEKNGKVKLMSINPATMSKKFNNDELLKLCDEMTSLYESIMEEATL
ncbi:MAG: c-type cytochrome [Gammaproteobacteria bacterium]|nr:c-type cytochrome [Gammaproteobacteria bacterium]